MLYLNLKAVFNIRLVAAAYQNFRYVVYNNCMNT